MGEGNAVMRARAPTARRFDERGFTFMEVVMVLVLTFLVAGSLATFLGSSRSLERSARTQVRLEGDLRSGLLSIADLLRNVPETELGGFDADGKSTRPAFRRIVGQTAGEPTLGEAAWLEWRPSTGGRTDDPGGVHLIEGGVATLLAPKVSQDSFRVYRDGVNLRVAIEACCATGDGDEVIKRGGEVTVALRN